MRRRSVLAAAVLLFSASICFLVPRVLFDRTNYRVLVCLDWREFSTQAHAAGYEDEAWLLGRIASCGVNALSVEYLSLEDLILRGVVRRERIDGRGAVYVVCDERKAASLGVLESLSSLYEVDVVKSSFSGAGTELVVHTRAVDELERIPLFKPVPLLDAVHRLGMTPVFRFTNLQYAGERYLRMLLSSIPAGGWVVFSDKHALGYAGNLACTAALLRRRDVHVGLVEFAGQLGTSSLASMGCPAVVVHSVPPDELAKYTLPAVLARWLRAVRERNARLLYVHPFPVENLPFSGDSLRANLRYLADLVGRLEQAGYRAGVPADPRLLDGLLFSRPLRLSLAWGALFVLLMLACAVLKWKLSGAPLRPAFACMLLAGGALVSVGIWKLGLAGCGRWAASVTGVVGASLAGVLALETIFSPISPDSSSGLLETAAAGVGGSLAGACTAVAAGLVVQSFMCSSGALLKLQLYPAVKLLYVLPLIAVGWWAARRCGVDFTRPLTRMEALACLFAAAVFGYYVLRSGNHAAACLVSAFEKHLRDAMELVMVRPRFKEWMVGYPAFFLAAAAWRRGASRLAWGAGVLSCVAWISVVNTFAHVVSPPLLGLSRTAAGLALGIPIGFVLSAVSLLLLHYTRDGIMVVGYHSCGNLGDDILAGRVEGLLVEAAGEGAADSVPIYWLRGRPASGSWASAGDGRSGLEFVSVPRYSPGAVFSASLCSRMVLLGGGGLLQEKSGLTTPIYYSVPPLIAHACRGARILGIAQGLGPLYSSTARDFARALMENSSLFWVRDSSSLELVEGLLESDAGGDSRFRVVPDLFWWMTDEEAGVWESVGPGRYSGGGRLERVVVECRRDTEWNPATVARTVCAALKDLGAKGRLEIVVLTMDAVLDRGASSALREIFASVKQQKMSFDVVARSPADERELSMLMGKGRTLVVCTRLHTLCAAVASCSPVVVFDYDPKISSFVGDNDLGEAVAMVNAGLGKEEWIAALRRNVVECWKGAHARAAALARTRGRLMAEGRRVRGEFVSLLRAWLETSFPSCG